MPRPQFTLRALLVAMLVVGAFFGRMAFQAKIEAKRRADEGELFLDSWLETMRKREPRKIYQTREVHPGGGALINDLPGN
ncbi:MAG TPA: hypothetical protein VG826_20760 [Pirellulales bacterium]|nr:hypothetical protein [Pirellulales bacterium]